MTGHSDEHETVSSDTVLYKDLQSGKCTVGANLEANLRTMYKATQYCDLATVKTLAVESTGWVVDGSTDCLKPSFEYAINKLTKLGVMSALERKWFRPAECPNHPTTVVENNVLGVLDMSGIFIINGVLMVFTFFGRMIRIPTP